MMAKYLILLGIDFFCAFSVLSKFPLISIFISICVYLYIQFIHTFYIYICMCVCTYVIQTYFLDLHQKHKKQPHQYKLIRDSNFLCVYSVLVQQTLKEAISPESIF